jgi:hypothetical protein
MRWSSCALWEPRTHQDYPGRNVPSPLRQFLLGHEVLTVQELGWTGISNGSLVARVDGNFDVLILADKNLRYQQNLAHRRVALIELPTNRWPAVKAMAARIATAVQQALPGSYTVLDT